MTVYGLPNCDSTKAALKWLKQHNISYTFHDYKVNGITAAHINKWLEKIPLEKLLNKKSTTWRSLSPEQQAGALSVDGAVLLMAKHTSLIKRPLVEWGEAGYTAGFDEVMFERMVNSQ